MFLDLIICFFLVFSFPIPIVGNSLILVFFIVAIRIIFRPSILLTFYNLLSLKYFFLIVVLLVIGGVLSFVHPIILGTNDFEKSYTYISLLIGLVLSLLFISSSTNILSKRSYLMKLILIVFFIQSLIQLLAFSNLEIRKLVQLFQFQQDTERALYYGGIRGLTISGRLFFELAASYGLVAIFYINYVLGFNRVFSYKEIIVFLILFVGSFFTGRTAIIGFAIAIIYYLVANQSLAIKMKGCLKISMTIVCLGLVVISILPPSVLDYVTSKLLPWVFELVYSYISTGEMHSNSLESLNNMYDINLSLSDFFIGTGHYVNSDGTYYMHTDSGFLRQILFWGIGGLLFNFLLTYYMVFYPYSLTKKELSDKFYYLLILAYIFILQYKGEIWGHSRFFLTILFLGMIQVVINKLYIHDK